MVLVTAALPIKMYSPDLMVCSAKEAAPIHVHVDILMVPYPWPASPIAHFPQPMALQAVPRLHCLVVGCGLGRDTDWWKSAVLPIIDQVPP